MFPGPSPETLDALRPVILADAPVPPDEADGWVRFICERLPADVALARVELIRRRLPDLLVAFRCLTGSTSAQTLFVNRCSVLVRGALQRRGFDGGTVDDLLQDVLTALIIGKEGARPRLEQYEGRGPLDQWVRVSAVHLALQHARGRRDDDTVDVEVLVDTANGVHGKVMAQMHAGQISEWTRGALLRLDPKERLALKLHWVDGLSVEAVGLAMGLHKSNAARWVARARDRLRSEVERAAFECLALSPSDLGSLARSLHSQIDISIVGALRSDMGPLRQD
jgi:RNA polymerase sigma-70 factor (ECF subfamily)